MRSIFILAAVCFFIPYSAYAATTDTEVLIFENTSAHDIKVVAPEIGFILAAGDKKKITQQKDKTPDVKLNIWWKHNPLELCQILTPWSRRVLIDGKITIICRSKNLE